MINTGVKRKKRSELGIALSSVRRFEAWEKTGDRIKDGVRNGIKEGRGGILLWELGNLASFLHGNTELLVMTPVRAYMYVHPRI